MRFPSLLLVLTVAACGQKVLPPVATPARIVPSVAEPDPAPRGTRRVLIDVVNRRARVTEVVGEYSDYDPEAEGHPGPTTHPLEREACAQTPCAIDLSLGRHQLNLRALDDDDATAAATVDVATRALAVRGALGFKREHPRKRLAGSLVLAAGVLLGVNSVILGGVDASGSSTTLTWAAGITGDVSLISLVTGIVLLTLGRTEVQSGSATVWELPDR